jgi:multiple sugar transport system permease protein
LTRPDQYTLSLALQAFQSQHGGTEQNLLMAAAVMTVMPVVLLFFLVQKSFIEGISTTGMKG